MNRDDIKNKHNDDSNHNQNGICVKCNLHKNLSFNKNMGSYRLRCKLKVIDEEIIS